MVRSMAGRLLQTLHNGTVASPGCRVNHARGILLTGIFRANPEAAKLSNSWFLRDAPVPVMVRFSETTGLADIAQNDPRANPRGIAVRFHDPDHAFDMVGHAANGFPARTSSEFIEFLEAINLQVTRPELLERHLAQNEAARRFMAAARPTPQSYVSERYFLLHGFVLTSAIGEKTRGKICIEPVTVAAYLNGNALVRTGANFMQQEIRQRLRDGPASMRIAFQPAEAADRLDDISAPWAENHQKVTLGQIVLHALAPDQTAQGNLGFTPCRADADFDFTGDPMISMRNEVYGLAFSRRRARQSSA